MTVILNNVIKLTPENSKTNIIIPFQLTRDYKRLLVNTSYWPKKLEDEKKAEALINSALNIYTDSNKTHSKYEWQNYLPVVNLITFSLDYKDKYLGCAHRQEPEQEFYIDENDASPGFEPHNPVKGEYRVVLNIHGIFTDTCDYSLCITAE